MTSSRLIVNKIILFVMIAAAQLAVFAQDSSMIIPPDAAAFIGKDQKALAFESGDLNGDGTIDHILVLENSVTNPDEDGSDKRTLLIITRGADQKLTLAKRNDRIVLCRSCGGSFGDPFDGVYIERNGFTVHNYGGSWQRWSLDIQFKYSRLDRTWQLVRFDKEEYDSHDPNKVGTSSSKTPRDFGKIDIADFDPDAVPNTKGSLRPVKPKKHSK
jgi:hypothetical protein